MIVHRRGCENSFVGHSRMVVVPDAALQPFRACSTERELADTLSGSKFQLRAVARRKL
jgi:hypothetical protein